LAARSVLYGRLTSYEGIIFDSWENDVL